MSSKTFNEVYIELIKDFNCYKILDSGCGKGELVKEAFEKADKIIKLDINTICLHGDNKDSVILAKKLKKELINSGCEIKSLPTFIK